VTSSDRSQPGPAAPGGRALSRGRLLQAIVEIARSVFGAAAASVFLVDQATGDLVFAAVAGEGEGDLVGRRFPAGTGVAGWVASYGQPLLVDDTADSVLFAPGAAASTGYVPGSIMAAPLIAAGECLGVVEVLDRGSRLRGELGDVDLLGLLAVQLGTALELLSADVLAAVPGAARGQDVLVAPDARLLQRVAERLPDAAEPVAGTVRSLLAMADDLLSRDRVPVGPARA
jgi:signal transduction protein with GAF and PtsI domain